MCEREQTNGKIIIHIGQCKQPSPFWRQWFNFDLLSMFVCTVFLCSEGLFQTSLTFGFYSKTSTYLDELFA